MNMSMQQDCELIRDIIVHIKPKNKGKTNADTMMLKFY